ncbi:MAG: hypothetical protein ABSG70_19610 [Terriglobales bacterium]|jgi:hypothetical protein
MANGDFLKSAVDSWDKLTDILNVGRIIFYPAAGFCALLPVAMTLRMLAHPAAAPYWTQFLSDLVVCSKSGTVWIASLVFGFLIANLGFITVIDRFAAPPQVTTDTNSYEYSYPRLFSGGIAPKDGHDYAAWLIAEYYRYVEIAVYIPYGILLSLPVYSIYSLLYLIRALGLSEPLALNAAHFAFAIWTIGSVVAWAVIWPEFWLPRVAEPLFQGWVQSRRAAIQGLEDFVGGTKPPEQSETQPSEKNK